MGYTIKLFDEGAEPVALVHSNIFGGGQSCVSSPNRAEMLMTYNYGPILCQHFHYDDKKELSGIRWLNDKRAKETTQKLFNAVFQLGIERDGDYWLATKGNVGYSLWILLGWALEHPNATWRVLH